MDSIHVVIRVRPLLEKEETVHWQVNDNTILQVDSSKKPLCQPYVFNRVFDSNATSAEVFDEIGRPTLDAIIEGYNGTILAYGQTSSGKTHTMMGTEANKGLIPRMAQALFESIENTPLRRFLLRVSYMEIYNEKVFDLLSDSRKQLNVREDMTGQTFVENLTEQFVSNCAGLLGIMRKGECSRSYTATDANVNSSRSHTIFRMIIESELLMEDLSVSSSEVSEASQSNSVVMVSQLNLVDLAGSERAGQSGSSGNRFKEGCAINTSLLSLRNVITKLSQADGLFINFRDSKLTRILQSSLGGNAKTSIICTVTPAMIEETHSTLKFAKTAKTIKNKPQINEVLSEEAMLKRYMREIDTLHKELELHKQVNKDKDLKLQESSQKNQELEVQLKVLSERIITSSLSRELRTVPKARRETWGGHLGSFKTGLEDQACLAFGSICKSGKINNYLDLEILPSSRQQCVKFDLSSVNEQWNFTDPTSSESATESSEAACQVDLNCENKQKVTLEMLTCENATLREKSERRKQKIIRLYTELNNERAQRRMAEDNHRNDKTFQFVQEENYIQDMEVKSLEEKVANLTKTVEDLQVLLLESNKAQSVMVSEKTQLMENVTKIEEQISGLKNVANKCKKEHGPLTVANREIQEQLRIASLKVEQLTHELDDCAVKYELQSKQSEILKLELRQELQKAYDYILRLEKLNSSHVSETGVFIKKMLDKSISAIVCEAAASPDHGIEDFWRSRRNINDCSYDTEMQIVQMDFDIRESNLRQEIARKEAQISELEKLLSDSESKFAKLMADTEGKDLLFMEKDRKEKELLDELEGLSADVLEYKSYQKLAHDAELRANQTMKEKSELQQKLELAEVTIKQKEDRFKIEVELLHTELCYCKGLLSEMDKRANQNAQELAEAQKTTSELENVVGEYKQNEKCPADDIANMKLEPAQYKELISQSAQKSSTNGELFVTWKSNEGMEKLNLIPRSETDVKELEIFKADLQHLLSTDDMKVRIEELEKQALESRAKEKLLENVVAKAEGLENQIQDCKEAEKQISYNVKLTDHDYCQNLANDSRIDTIEFYQEIEVLEKPATDHEGQYFTNETESMQKEQSTDCDKQSDENAQKMVEKERNNEELENLLSDKRPLKTTLSIMENQIQDYRKQQKRLADEVKTIMSDARDYYQKLAHEAELCVNQALEEKCELRKIIRELETNVQQKEYLTLEMEDVKKELDRYKNLSSETDKRANLNAQELAEMQMKNNKMEHFLSECRENEKYLQNEIARMQLQLSEYSNLISEHDLKVNDMNEVLMDIRKHSDFLENCVQQHVQSNKIQLEELEKLKVEAERYSEQKNKATDLQRKIVECQQREKQLRQYVQTLELDLQHRNESQFYLNELRGELEKCKQNEEKYAACIKEKDDALKQTKQLLETKLEKYENVEERLKQEVFELKNSEKFLQNFLLELQDREAELGKKLEQEIGHKQTLRTHLDKNEKDHLKEIELLKDSVADLEQQLNEAKKSCQEMHQNLTLLKSQRTEFAEDRDTDTITLTASKGTQCEMIQVDSENNQKLKSPIMISNGIQCTLLDASYNGTYISESSKTFKDASCSTVDIVMRAASVLNFTKGIQCEFSHEGTTLSKTSRDTQYEMMQVDGENSNQILKSPIISKDVQCVLLDGSKNGMHITEGRKTLKDASTLTVDLKAVSVLKFTKGIQCELPPIILTPANQQPSNDEDLTTCSESELEVKSLKEEIERQKEHTAALIKNYAELRMDHGLLQHLVTELKQHKMQLEYELNVSKAESGMHFNYPATPGDEGNHGSVTKFTKGIQCELSSVMLTQNSQPNGETSTVAGESKLEVKSLREEIDRLNEYNATILKKYGEIRMDHILLQHLVTELKQHKRQLEYELDVSKAENVSHYTEPPTPGDKKCNDAYKLALKEKAIAVNELEKLRNELEMCKVNYDTLREELSTKGKELYQALQANSEEKKKYNNSLTSLEQELQFFKDRCEQLKSEIRHLHNKNTTISSEFWKAPALTTDSGCDTKYTEQCSSGSGVVTLSRVDTLQAKYDKLKKEYLKMQKMYCKQKQQTEQTRIKIKSRTKPEERNSSVENTPPTSNAHIHVLPLPPPTAICQTPEQANYASPLKEMNLRMDMSSNVTLRKTEDFFNENLTYSSLDKNLDCKVS